MNISWIRKKVQSGEYDLSAHAYLERQEEQITIAEIDSHGHSPWSSLSSLRGNESEASPTVRSRGPRSLEIEKTLLKGSIIEQYSNDPRGESCLVGARVSRKSLHVVCGKRSRKLLIVTVYRPKPPTWRNYKIRAKESESRG